MVFDFSYETIIEAIHIPNEGKHIKRELQLKKLEEIFNFRQKGEDFIKSGLGFK